MTKLTISDVHAPTRLNLRLGSFAGFSSRIINASAMVDSINTEKTFWPIAGNISYATSQADVFLSSSDASDVGLIILVNGLDSLRQPVTGFAILNGQSQVLVMDASFANSVPMIRVLGMATVATSSDLIPAEHLGTIYCAESDTLTGGVPDTTALVRMVMRPETNVSSGAYFTVPKDHIAQLEKVIILPASNKPVDVIIRITTFASNVPITSSAELGMHISAPLTISNFLEHIPFVEGEDIEIRFESTDNNAEAGIIIAYVLVHKSNQLIFPPSSFGIFS